MSNSGKKMVIDKKIPINLMEDRIMQPSSSTKKLKIKEMFGKGNKEVKEEKDYKYLIKEELKLKKLIKINGEKEIDEDIKFEYTPEVKEENDIDENQTNLLEGIIPEGKKKSKRTMLIPVAKNNKRKGNLGNINNYIKNNNKKYYSIYCDLQILKAERLYQTSNDKYPTVNSLIMELSLKLNRTLKSIRRRRDKLKLLSFLQIKVLVSYSNKFSKELKQRKMVFNQNEDIIIEKMEGTNIPENEFSFLKNKIKEMPDDDDISHIDDSLNDVESQYSVKKSIKENEFKEKEYSSLSKEDDELLSRKIFEYQTSNISYRDIFIDIQNLKNENSSFVSQDKVVLQISDQKLLKNPVKLVKSKKIHTIDLDASDNKENQKQICNPVETIDLLQDPNLDVITHQKSPSISSVEKKVNYDLFNIPEEVDKSLIKENQVPPQQHHSLLEEHNLNTLSDSKNEDSNNIDIKQTFRITEQFFKIKK